VCVCVSECACGEGACVWHVWVGGCVGKCVGVGVPVWTCESEGVNVDRRLGISVIASASVSASACARERGRERQSVHARAL
jgi:hypothetical protein